VSDGETAFPAQQQEHPGTTALMEPRPRDTMSDWEGTGALAGLVALVTGGDSGIGRAVAIGYAKEGADVAIAYLSEDDDAAETQRHIESAGRRCLLLRGDLSEERHCAEVVARTVEHFGRIDVLVNNIAYQEPQNALEDISTEQWERTLRTNITSFFFVTRAALPHMRRGGAIINTSSINGLRGNKSLIDYATTKGAVNAFTYSLAQTLVDRGIRVNAVAPGPVWTPLIPATMSREKVERFGRQVPMQEAAHPDDIAPSYIFFASERLSAYYSGEVLAPIGGETLPG
jgi:NAD(P)-dependent dehydrogenase (short-subunit alcohol dehydrogenase family)